MTSLGAARRGRPPAPATLAAALGALALLCLAVLVPLSLMAHQLANGLVPAVIGVPCLGVGVLVARRQPRNPLGWLFLAIALCLFAGTDGGDYAVLDYRLGHHLPLGLAGALLAQLWAPGIELFVVVILLFPDGTLPSALWRWALRAYCTIFAFMLVALAVATAGALVGHHIRVNPTGGLRATDNPAGWYGAVQTLALGALLLLAVCFVGRQVLSWRLSSGERRQQLKWLATGAAVTLAGAVLTSLVGIGWFAYAAVPVCMGIAILKYRLYEIDRIISRTLAYAIMTGLLVGLYTGLVLLATRVLGFKTPVAVAASTLAAVALFTPVRLRVQRIVDRRFNRARYDAERTVAAFSARLKDAVDTGAVRDDLLAVVDRSLEPAHLSVWIAGGQP